MKQAASPAFNAKGPEIMSETLTANAPATRASCGNPDGGFIWYELMTPDPEGAKAFYEPVVGWTLSTGHGDTDDSGFITRADGGLTGGVPYGGYAAPAEASGEFRNIAVRTGEHDDVPWAVCVHRFGDTRRIRPLEPLAYNQFALRNRQGKV